MTYYEKIKSQGIDQVVEILEIANEDLCINRKLDDCKNCFYKKICKENVDVKDWLESEINGL